MKKLTILATVLVGLLSFALSDIVSSQKLSPLISPLTKQANVLGINQWLPKKEQSRENFLEISSEAAIFIDAKNGEVLYAKNMHEKLAIASLVKVMTALIALERKDMDDLFFVSQKAADMEPDKMLLIAGEKLTLRELLSGIFLISANDGAEVLAEGVTGNREEFIELMNIKAKQLGMNSSYFVNPTGLDEDTGSSYSTAYDLAILTRYIIKSFPEIIDITAKDHIYLPITENHQDYDMYSGINLLTTYPGVVGFKTGYTPEAGYTLITLARRDNREVIGVLLNSQSRRDEARELLDYSFGKI